MTCPDHDALLSGDANALRHAEGCPQCQAVLETISAVRQAFTPVGVVDARQVASVLEARRQAETEDRRRTRVGALTTFVLAALTAIPASIAALDAASADDVTLLPVVVCVLAMAGVVTWLEPHFTDG